MAEDLYTAWLRVPAGARPPDHYALLGIPRFCSDLEKIEEAVMRQFDRLDRRALHPDPIQREACQRMMNEIARARLVLASALSRAAYEQSLRGNASIPMRPTSRPTPTLQESGIDEVVARLPSVVQDVSRPAAVAAAVESLRTAVTVRRKIRRARTRRQSLLLALIGVGLLAFAIPSIVDQLPASSEKKPTEFKRKLAVGSPTLQRPANPTDWEGKEFKLTGGTDLAPINGLRYPLVTGTHDGQVFVLNLENGTCTTLPPPPAGKPTEPQAAGDRVVFRVGNELFVHRLDGGNETKLAGGCGAFSLRTAAVAYVSQGDIYLTQLETLASTRITSDGKPKSNVILTDTQLIWLSGGEFFGYDLQSGRTTKTAAQCSQPLGSDAVGDLLVWVVTGNGRADNILCHDFRSGEGSEVPRFDNVTVGLPRTDGNRIVWCGLHQNPRECNAWLYDAASGESVKIYTSQRLVFEPAISADMVAFENLLPNNRFQLITFDGVSARPLDWAQNVFGPLAIRKGKLLWFSQGTDPGLGSWIKYWIASPPEFQLIEKRSGVGM